MTKIYVGCAGWDYKGWIGTFYPKNLKKEHFLSHYSKIFNFMEINATFYNLPKENAVKHWNNQVPDNFLFSVKVWQNITHKFNLSDIDSKIDLFFNRMSYLKSKIFGYLLQFPPKFGYNKKNQKYLEKILNKLPTESKYFLEFRDNSWFEPKILNPILADTRLILVTSYIIDVKPYYHPKQSLYYIRLIGDHQLESFDRIQRNQDESLEDLDLNIKSIVNSPSIKKVVVIFNNNFRGFAPEDANEFKNRVGLPIHRFPQQHNLFDFM